MPKHNIFQKLLILILLGMLTITLIGIIIYLLLITEYVALLSQIKAIEAKIAEADLLWLQIEEASIALKHKLDSIYFFQHIPQRYKWVEQIAVYEGYHTQYLAKKSTLTSELDSLLLKKESTRYILCRLMDICQAKKKNFLDLFQ